MVAVKATTPRFALDSFAMLSSTAECGARPQLNAVHRRWCKSGRGGTWLDRTRQTTRGYGTQYEWRELTQVPAPCTTRPYYAQPGNAKQYTAMRRAARPYLCLRHASRKPVRGYGGRPIDLPPHALPMNALRCDGGPHNAARISHGTIAPVIGRIAIISAPNPAVRCYA